MQLNYKDMQLNQKGYSCNISILLLFGKSYMEVNKELHGTAQKQKLQ